MEIFNQININSILLLLIGGIIFHHIINVCIKNIFYPYMNYKRDALFMDKEIDDNTFLLLDKFIMEIFNEYRVLNLEYKELDYINAEMEKNILEDLKTLVLYKISPNLLNKLYVIYDLTSEEKFNDLLDKRCRIIILGYILEKNKMK